ncbi:LPS export ABC transporter periplasmic protein LptC [Rhizobium sp. LjRoot254]|uniref:LPS export ABC transporter periplasmic protein LptC n=1 Tax=Rhizobium sp. LjRoot254 TaxID=3342297 RepID=UPI003ECD31C4
MDIRAPLSLSRQSPASLYGRAIRHSGRVRRLKVMLPVLAVIISLAFVAVSWVRTMFPANLTISGAKIEDGRVVMEKPAISGRNQDGISYFMNARRALQAIINPSDIELQDIDAAVPIRGDLVAHIKASGAKFDRDTDRLDMTSPFEVTLSSGLRAAFQSAHLDVKGGLMTSDDPVSITAKGATLVANSLKITDKGRIMNFKGNVRMVVEPTAVRRTAADVKSTSNQ